MFPLMCRRLVRILGYRLGFCLACACMVFWAHGYVHAQAQAPAQMLAQVRPGVAITLPRDHGAHPDFRTEWWYLTGWLQTPQGEDLAFQVTFSAAERAWAKLTPANLCHARSCLRTRH